MSQQSSKSPSTGSLGRTVIAGLIILLAAYVLLKVVIGIALAIAGPVLLILAVVALIWAYRVLF